MVLLLLCKRQEAILLFLKLFQNFFEVRPSIQCQKNEGGKPVSFYKENEIEEWYSQYHQTIFKYIILMVKDSQQAEDLTQETFLRAISIIIHLKEILPRKHGFSKLHIILLSITSAK